MGQARPEADGGDNMGPSREEQEEMKEALCRERSIERLIIDNNKSGADGGASIMRSMSMQNTICWETSRANGGGIYNDAAATILNTTVAL